MPSPPSQTTPELEACSRLLKACADPTRLRLLALLRHGELCVCDLTAVLELPQSTVSRHLAWLRDNGWIESRRMGKWIHYQLHRKPPWPELQSALVAALPAIEQLAADHQALLAHLASKDQKHCQ